MAKKQPQKTYATLGQYLREVKKWECESLVPRRPYVREYMRITSLPMEIRVPEEAQEVFSEYYQTQGLVTRRGNFDFNFEGKGKLIGITLGLNQDKGLGFIFVNDLLHSAFPPVEHPRVVMG